MGALESSRKANLPENINDVETRTKTINSWTEDKIGACPWNVAQSNPIPTLRPDTIITAGEFIKTYFESHPINGGLQILDIFSGNCQASLIVHNSINSFGRTWICTDIIDFKSKPEFPVNMIFDKLNPVGAVEKYGSQSNILLMISPPPFPNPSAKDLGYADYYSCFDYIAQTLKDHSVAKYIIFVGELGASDGSKGMYKYLIEHPNLDLVCREMLTMDPDIFGDPCEKELFIFSIPRSDAH
jgi:hypothetical protein